MSVGAGELKKAKRDSSTAQAGPSTPLRTGAFAGANARKKRRAAPLGMTGLRTEERVMPRAGTRSRQPRRAVEEIGHRLKSVALVMTDGSWPGGVECGLRRKEKTGTACRAPTGKEKVRKKQVPRSARNDGVGAELKGVQLSSLLNFT